MVSGEDVLIGLSGVSFHYEAGRPVLAGLALRLKRGERIGLVGANGSGKTSLLHLLVGLLHPTAGEVAVFGQPRRTERDFRDVRRRVGLVFQDPEDQLFCPTVAEDVAFGPLNLGKDEAEAMEIVHTALGQLGLEDLADRITYRLSFGQKKLVSIAAVLAMQPEVLLLDEPDVGLDEDHENQLVRVLNDLPLTMLIVSHHQAFLERVTERCLVLGGGRLEPLPRLDQQWAAGE
jgi:cobalt/nickel transport system ATP-binding protein